MPMDKKRLDNSLRELKEFKFLTRYGDIAGLVWNDLKVADTRLPISFLFPGNLKSD